MQLQRREGLPTCCARSAACPLAAPDPPTACLPAAVECSRLPCECSRLPTPVRAAVAPPAAWNQRVFVLRNAPPTAIGPPAEAYDREVDFVARQLCAAPHNESCWEVLRALAAGPGAPPRALAADPRYLQLCREVLGGEGSDGGLPACAPALSLLADVLLEQAALLRDAAALLLGSTASGDRGHDGGAAGAGAAGAAAGDAGGASALDPAALAAAVAAARRLTAQVLERQLAADPIKRPYLRLELASVEAALVGAAAQGAGAAGA